MISCSAFDCSQCRRSRSDPQPGTSALCWTLYVKTRRLLGPLRRYALERRPSPILSDNSEIGRTTGKPTLHLGSFNKLWEKLGISIEAPPPALGPVELDTDISSSDDALSSSPADVPAVTTATTPDLQVTTLDSPICLGLPANHIATTGLVPTLNPPETPRYDLRSSKKKSVYLKDSINPEARLALNKRLPRLSDETPSASSKEHQSVDDSP